MGSNSQKSSLLVLFEHLNQLIRKMKEDLKLTATDRAKLFWPLENEQRVYSRLKLCFWFKKKV